MMQIDGDWDRRCNFFNNRFFVLRRYGADGYGSNVGYLPITRDYSRRLLATSASSTEPLKQCQPDATVEATQEELAQLGYYNGPVDGILGPTTRDAVANYQIAKQLNVTGSLSPDTMQSLGLSEPASS